MKRTSLILYIALNLIAFILLSNQASSLTVSASSNDGNIPQNRERVYIVGFKKKTGLMIHLEAIKTNLSKTIYELEEVYKKQLEIDKEVQGIISLAKRAWGG